MHRFFGIRRIWAEAGGMELFDQETKKALETRAFFYIESGTPEGT
jgi:hypothetical protein